MPQGNTFKKDKKCFLFHVKIYFCSQDISIFVPTFQSYRKTAG